MESSFGQDFSSVSAYTGASSEMSALGANAAAQGETVAFASPTPSVETTAHELAHVVQSRNVSGGGAVQGEGEVGSAHSSAEAEASAAGSAVAAGKSFQVTGTPGAGIQLKEDAKPAKGSGWSGSKDEALDAAGSIGKAGGEFSAAHKAIEKIQKGDFAENSSGAKEMLNAEEAASETGGFTAFMKKLTTGALGSVLQTVAAGVGVVGAWMGFSAKTQAMEAFDEAALKAKQAEPEDTEMLEIAEYGFGKISTGWGAALKKLWEKMVILMGAIAAACGGAAGGAFAATSTAISKFSSGIETAGRSIKGIWKWVIGTRGKNREAAASKIYNRVVLEEGAGGIASELVVQAMQEDTITGGGIGNSIASSVGMGKMTISSLQDEDGNQIESIEGRAKKLSQDVAKIDKNASDGKEDAIAAKKQLVADLKKLMSSKA
jgi:hypothetical protein